MPAQLNEKVILAAIEGFELQKSRIDQQISDLKVLLPGGNTLPATADTAVEPKRTISAAARRKMAAGQKARWAKLRGESEPPSPAPAEAPKAKRQISKEGLARIVAATKARWARVRAEKAKAQSAVAKKSAPAPRRTAVKKKAIKKASVKKTAQAPTLATAQPAG